MRWARQALRHASAAAAARPPRMHAAERRLPYQHDYHAGNFADVVKHTVLLLLMQRMADKESPFMYVETHAGAGSYDLRDGKAAQLNEQAAGIALLQAHAESAGVDALPPPAQRLVEMIAADGRYPGSPRLAAELLRPQDSLLLCELAAEQHERLCRWHQSWQHRPLSQRQWPALPIRRVYPPLPSQILLLHELRLLL